MPNKKTKQQTNEFVGAIDQGTSSSRFLIFNASNLELVTYHQETIEISTPQPGWVEQDPNELLEKTTLCIEKAVEKFEGLGHNKSDIKVIGITNQRETTILWDKETGKVLHNALVWLDARTQETVDFLLKQYNKRQDCLQEKCGLPLSTYFSALKIRWLMDNCDEVRTAIEEKRCCFGTVDSWLLYNLLSDDKNTVHVTDVTNASRTMLMNIRTLKWDASLCDFFSIPEHILPEIKSSSTIFGYINKGALQGVPVGAVLGDQQAALVGQRCWTKGTAKSTYGTGCFILYNTGNDLAYSLNGLLTTVAYKWNDDDPVYALEGSIAIAGQCIKWLRDNLGLIPDSKSTETIAASVKDTGGVYFVPAFSGLFAPYWRSDARGLITGMTQYTTKAHIVRAALEGICYQTREIVDAMYDDSGVRLSKLKVDGGMANNKLFLHMLADIVGMNVTTPGLSETTALGAALAAGKAKGIDLFQLDDENEIDTKMSSYTPKIHGEQREENFASWKKAVIKSFERLTPPFNIENKSMHEEKSHLSTTTTVAWLTLTSLLGVLLYMSSRNH
ncbi:unnamed protein product [Adineta steineri]|uniref:Probable glycerol kinase n=1 Tax=Adineta steineri TaxID=433720 RepID=A0A813Q8K8_9BILA|nr:unnamed protein product [Adineta steineri]CAF1240651.1 unnamed protein product [Adineta steineri]CAF3646915.1 unnamed protein product [Adineta steineri]CAF3974432.1 unnamed protein product [Adineta steineri]